MTTPWAGRVQTLGATMSEQLRSLTARAKLLAARMTGIRRQA